MLFGRRLKDRPLRGRQLLKNLPITWKVTIWYTSFIAIILIGLSVFAVTMTASLIRDSGEGALVEKVTEMAQASKTFEPFDDGVFFAVVDHGKLVAGAYPRNFDGGASFSGERVRTLKMKKDKYMYYDVKIGGSSAERWIRGVVPLSKSMAIVRTLTLALVVISPLVLALISIGGYRIIKKAFLPVKKLSQTAHEIELSKDFSRRLYVSDVKDEIHDMSLVLNGMLGALEQTYIKEKQFSHDVSHELRTPVSVILSESEYGLKYPLDEVERKATFEVIHRQSLRMSRMIRSVLELSRMDHLSRLDKMPVNISDVLNRIVEDDRIICSSRGIELAAEIAPGVVVETNQLLFERLVDNLLSNAIKFTNNRIEVRLTRTPVGVEFAVQDNGCGMSEAEAAQIWQRFYQADASRNKKENPGIGLGLSFVDQILTLNGWRIRVESAPEQGSTFTVFIQ